jgi:hypothetical protein
MLPFFSLLCQCCSRHFFLVSSLSRFVYFSLCSDMGSTDLGLSFLLAPSHLGLVLPLLLELMIYSLCFTFDCKQWKPTTLNPAKNYWTNTKFESHMLPFSICYFCFEYYLIFFSVAIKRYRMEISTFTSRSIHSFFSIFSIYVAVRFPALHALFLHLDKCLFCVIYIFTTYCLSSFAH